MRSSFNEMPKTRRPPIDFWLWLLVAGVIAVFVVLSLTLPERIQPRPSVSEFSQTAR